LPPDNNAPQFLHIMSSMRTFTLANADFTRVEIDG
jgi:hypothetical protein